MRRIDSESDFFAEKRVATFLANTASRDVSSGEVDDPSSIRQQLERIDRVHRLRACWRHRARRILTLRSNLNSSSRHPRESGQPYLAALVSGDGGRATDVSFGAGGYESLRDDEVAGGAFRHYEICDTVDRRL